MADTFSLTVNQVIREVADVVTIIFDPHDEEALCYQPGQFLTFLLTIDGKKLRRSYSLSSSPQIDESLAVSIKCIPGGLVSTYLYHTIKPGDRLETLKPMGTFVPTLASQNRRTLLLIGAGSGITPLLSMAKSALHAEPNSRIWLIYGNRHEASILYKAQLDAVQQLYGPTRFQITHVLSQPSQDWSGLAGRINQQMLLSILVNLAAQEILSGSVYMCGPGSMMVDARIALNQLGFAANQIYQESFFVLPSDGSTANTAICGGQTSAEVTVLYDGQTHLITVSNDQTILQAALACGIDLPYSCQMGICASCRGKCTSGTVKQDDEDALTTDERQTGCVLTCVGYAVSKTVTIEID